MSMTFDQEAAYTRNIGVERKPIAFGVFVWSADQCDYRAQNVYGRKEHVRGAGCNAYATERGAQAKADRLNADPEHYGRTYGRGFVVRAI